MTKWKNFGNRRIARRMQRHTRSIFIHIGNLKIADIHILIPRNDLPNGQDDGVGPSILEMEKLNKYTS